ncbi:MAG: histidine kinase [Hungatella sp.]
MKILIHWFSSLKNSIHKKLTVILISVSILPVLFLAAVIYMNASREAEKNYIDYTSAFLNNVNGRLDDYMEQLDALSFLLFYDSSDAYNRPAWEQYNSTQRQLLNIYGQRKEISSVFYLLDESDELYIVSSGGNRSFFDNPTIRSSDWYLDSMNTDSRFMIEPLRQLTGYENRYEIDSREPVFSFSRRFHLLTKETGILSLNCTLASIERICSDMVLYEDETMQYLNKNGDMIFHQGTLAEKEQKQLYEIISTESSHTNSIQYKSLTDHQIKTVVYIRSDISGTVLYKTIPNRILHSGIAESMKLMLLFLIFTVLAMIFIGILISKRVTKPLSNLQLQMKRIGQGDRNAQVSVDSVDEIGQLSQTFNQMNNEINHLIDEQYRLRLASQTAQLNTLLAQINPHFINNILQSIAGVAIDKQVPEIYEAASVLAKMLRYSLKGKDKVSLKEEIENVQDYLFIQKFRYEDKLQYHIECHGDLANLTVPKLTLQPLVENAVVHGIEPKKGVGTVQITCNYRENVLSVIIADDGVGMDDATKKRIQNQLLQVNQDTFYDTEHIGVQNVCQRLMLIYADDVSMRLDVPKEGGCIVEIQLKQVEET